MRSWPWPTSGRQTLTNPDVESRKGILYRDRACAAGAMPEQSWRRDPSRGGQPDTDRSSVREARDEPWQDGDDQADAEGIEQEGHQDEGDAGGAGASQAVITLG